jgi:hypothetical protein
MIVIVRMVVIVRMRMLVRGCNNVHGILHCSVEVRNPGAGVVAASARRTHV